MLQIKVAEIPINIACHDKEFFEKRLKAYRIRDNEEHIEARMTIKSRTNEIMVLPKGNTIEKIRALTLAKTVDGRFFYYSANKNKQVVSCTVYDSDYSNVEITQLSTRRHSVFSLTDFEYIYTGMAFSNRLAIEGGLVLHASALKYDGKGIAFSAISGTGKSTHTGLWKKYLSDSVSIINDDKPAVRFVDGQPFLYGTPWSGKTDINNNICAPLSAIVFLQRSEENSIERLNIGDTYYEMANAVARPACDKALGERLIDTMEKLMKSVPVYRLCCNISRQAVETVYKEIIGRNMP